MANSGDASYLNAKFHSAHAFGERAPSLNVIAKTRQMAERSRAFSEGGTRRIGGGGESRAVGAGTMDAFDKSGDPIITGNFERNPRYQGRDFLDTMLGNAVTGGGQLTEHGKEEQALSQRVDQMSGLFNKALDQGATPQQAMTLVHRTDPSFIPDVLTKHPDALKIFESAASIHDWMTGKPPIPAYGKLDTKTGQQPVMDPNTGEVTGFNTPEGFIPPPTKGTKAQIIKTPEGTYVVDQNNPTQANPVMRSDTGEPVGGTKGTGTGPMASDGSIPQATTQASKITVQDKKVLESAPPLLTAMEDMLTQSRNMGLIKGPLKEAAGAYFGIHGPGAAFQRDWNLIKSQAPLWQGSGYKSAVDSFMAAIPTSNNAPTYAAAALPSMLETVRQRVQGTADSQNGYIPSTMATPLITHGVIPNGYQTPQTFSEIGPSATARWKAQFAPRWMSDNDKKTFATDVGNGVYGPVSGTIVSPDAQRGLDFARQDYQQRQAKQQQATAAGQADSTQVRPGPQAVPAAAPAPGAETQVVPDEQQMPSRNDLSGRATQPPASPNAGQPGFDEPNTPAGRDLAASRGAAPAAGGGMTGEQVPDVAPPQTDQEANPRAPSAYDGARLQSETPTSPAEAIAPAAATAPQKQQAPTPTPYLPPTVTPDSAIPIFPGGM